jgi:hypothetical protein
LDNIQEFKDSISKHELDLKEAISNKDKLKTEYIEAQKVADVANLKDLKIVVEATTAKVKELEKKGLNTVKAKEEEQNAMREYTEAIEISKYLESIKNK